MDEEDASALRADLEPLEAATARAARRATLFGDSAGATDVGRRVSSLALPPLESTPEVESEAPPLLFFFEKE